MKLVYVDNVLADPVHTYMSILHTYIHICLFVYQKLSFHISEIYDAWWDDCVKINNYKNIFSFKMNYMSRMLLQVFIILKCLRVIKHLL